MKRIFTCWIAVLIAISALAQPSSKRNYDGLTTGSQHITLRSSDSLNAPTKVLQLPFFQEDPEVSIFSLQDTDLSNYDVSPKLKKVSNAREFHFKTDGTQFYIVSRSKENIYTYHLATPWDITSVTLDADKTFDFSKELGHGPTGYTSSVAHGFYIRKKDGKRMWIWNRVEAWQYDLSTPWDLSTAKVSGYKDFRPKAERGHDIDFSYNGKYLYFDDRFKGYIAQYQLTSPWNIETATFVQTRKIKRQKAMRGTEFSPNGLKLFINDQGTDEIYEYHLSIPWDIATMEFYDKAGVGISGDDSRSITWNPDGKNFYIIQKSKRRIYRFYTTDENRKKSSQ